MEIDEDGDGVPDRREHYGPGEKLERTEYLERGRIVRRQADDAQSRSPEIHRGGALPRWSIASVVVVGQGQGQAKVTLCHKGKTTLTVADSAAGAHYAHGDTPGPCPASPSK